jgi:hypothetical protein
MGFSVWIDDRIDYGSQWPREIQKHLDSCDAFILIMSPRSFASEWVLSELQRAKRKAKPVFPLLLEGNETWLSVESTQYYDVRNWNVPDTEFYSDLKQAVSARIPSQPQGSVIKAEPVENIRSGRRKTVGLVAVGGIVAICFFLLSGVLLLPRLVNKGLSPAVATETGIITVPSNPLSPVTRTSAVISPIPWIATTTVLPVQLPGGSEVRMIDVAARNDYHYTVLSAQREALPQDKYLLRLRIRAGTSAASLGFWSDSFRLVAGDLSLAPINYLNLVVRQGETMEGEIEFEIDAALQEAILRITVAYSPDPWATKELRPVFP